MTSFARAERVSLADTLLAAGPDAPTLCEGWTTRDLAAHLVLRERRPDAAAGILIKPLADRTRRIQDGLAAGDYAALVGRVRTPAPWVRPGFAEDAVNLVEFFVHHEDVRRAVPGWSPRTLPEGYSARLGGRLKSSARLSARRFPATVVVRPTGAEAFQVGAGGDRVEVSGAPGELLLFFTGRQGSTAVETAGPSTLVERLRGARLGL